MGIEHHKIDALLTGLAETGHDLTLPLLLTLLAVGRSPGISVNEVAEVLGAPQQTASRYVSILQGRYQTVTGQPEAFSKAPLLTLDVSDDDPRKRALRLSKHGERRISKLLETVYQPGAAR